MTVGTSWGCGCSPIYVGSSGGTHVTSPRVPVSHLRQLIDEGVRYPAPRRRERKNSFTFTIILRISGYSLFCARRIASCLFRKPSSLFNRSLSMFNCSISISCSFVLMRRSATCFSSSRICFSNIARFLPFCSDCNLFISPPCLPMPLPLNVDPR